MFIRRHTFLATRNYFRTGPFEPTKACSHGANEVIMCCKSSRFSSVNNQHAAQPAHSYIHTVAQVLPSDMCETSVCLTTDRPSPSAVLKDMYDNASFPGISENESEYDE